MAIVTKTELATYMGIAEDTIPMEKALNSAELSIASELGALTLVQATAIENIELRTSRNRIEINNGVLYEIVSVTIDGKAVTLTDLKQSYWYIQYKESFGRGAAIVLTYKHGYKDSTEMPTRLLEAVLQVASWFYNEAPVGRKAKAERLGDYSITYSSDGPIGVPDIAKNLITEFRRPKL